MTEEMSESINELAQALAKAQGKIVGATKDSKNPFFKSSYADLAAVMDACREPLSSNGLSYTQLPGNRGDEVTVTTLLMHISGQWVRSVVGVVPAKTDAQGLGSVITYLRRYSLSGIAGIAQIDDDGNAGQHDKPKKAEPRLQQNKDAIALLKSAKTMPELEAMWLKLPATAHKAVGKDTLDEIKDALRA